MTNFPRIIYYKLKNKTKKNKNRIRCFCKSKWKQILLLRLKDNIFVYVARKTILLQYTIVTLFLAGEGEQKCPTHITFLNNFSNKDSSITFGNLIFKKSDFILDKSTLFNNSFLKNHIWVWFTTPTFFTRCY